MNVLFIHQNFPAQYRHLAQSLIERGDQVTALCIENRPVPQGVRVIRYKPQHGSTPKIHPWAQDSETKLIRGEACFHAMRHLQSQGYVPDIVCAHPGWGEALFAKDVWPQAPLLSYFEFYYHMSGADVGFDPEFPPDPLDGPRLRARNLVNLMNLELCDFGLAPTEWQKSLHPATFRDKIRVIHDGINTGLLAPNPSARLTIPNTGRSFGADEEIITFVNRNLEPYRGYHIFMRALPEILRRRPKAQVLIVGGDGVSYGKHPPQGNWRQIFFAEVKSDIDTGRVHFLGNVPYPAFVSLLQVSSVHVYLTYPFVLSWSMLEAMSAGCLVVGSSTPPVQEVLRDGENGLLVDFFSPSDIAAKVVAALEAHGDFARLRQAARQTIVDNYDLATICLPRQLAYLDEILG